MKKAALGLTLPRDSEEPVVTGFYDTNGRVDFEQQKDPAEIPKWKQRLQQVIHQSPETE